MGKNIGENSMLYKRVRRPTDSDLLKQIFQSQFLSIRFLKICYHLVLIIHLRL